MDRNLGEGVTLGVNGSFPVHTSRVRTDGTKHDDGLAPGEKGHSPCDTSWVREDYTKNHRVDPGCERVLPRAYAPGAKGRH